MWWSKTKNTHTTGYNSTKPKQWWQKMPLTLLLLIPLSWEVNRLQYSHIPGTDGTFMMLAKCATGWAAKLNLFVVNIYNQVRKQITVTYHITKWPHGTMTMLQSTTLQITHWWMEGQGVNKNNVGKLNHTLRCFGKQPILHDRPFRLFLLPSLLWYVSCTPRNMLLLKNSA